MYREEDKNEDGTFNYDTDQQRKNILGELKKMKALFSIIAITAILSAKMKVSDMWLLVSAG